MLSDHRKIPHHELIYQGLCTGTIKIIIGEKNTAVQQLLRGTHHSLALKDS